MSQMTIEDLKCIIGMREYGGVKGETESLYQLMILRLMKSHIC